MYDRRADGAAPHWMQCASEVTSGGVMVRAAPGNRRGGTPYGPRKGDEGSGGPPNTGQGKPRMLVIKPPRAEPRRYLPGSPFKPPAPPPPAETFAVHDQ